MAEEIKVSAMTFLDTVPDNAKIYVVVPGDPVPYYTTKEALLAGIGSGSGTLQQVTVNGNETNQGIVLVDEFDEKIRVLNSGEALSVLKQFIDGGVMSETPMASINQTGITFTFGSYTFQFSFDGLSNSFWTFPQTTAIEFVASREWVNEQGFGKTEVKNSNFTAVNGFRYVAVANLTVTDPTPFEGAVYEVLVSNGVISIGSTSYNVLGTVVRRFYRSGAWVTRTYVSDNVISSAVQTALDNKADEPVVTDISLTSTIVGWSTFTRREITVVDYGPCVLVLFALEGVSNSSSATFTLPFTNTGGLASAQIRVQNNGTFQTAPGLCQIVNGSAMINMFVNNTASAFTASNNKATIGQILIRK